MAAQAGAARAGSGRKFTRRRPSIEPTRLWARQAVESAGVVARPQGTSQSTVAGMESFGSTLARSQKESNLLWPNSLYSCLRSATAKLGSVHGARCADGWVASSLCLRATHLRFSSSSSLVEHPELLVRAANSLEPSMPDAANSL